jgi:RNA methyltransferase, TrmH family
MTMERPEQELLSNPRSDRVKAVARLSGRSARQRAGRFVVEGPQAVREAVALAAGGLPPGAPGTLRELYATVEAAQRYPQIVDAADRAGVAARLVTDEVFAAMVAGTGTLTPQGMLAVSDLISAGLAPVLDGRPELVVVLSQVRDPGNAGTVIRAADAAGADAVIVTDASVDVHNPKAVRATAGSLFHLPVVTGVPLAEVVAGLRAAGLWVLAADGAGDLDLDDLSDQAEFGQPRAATALSGPVAWLFGNEAWGLPDADRALADAVVRVPVHGRAESLNLATAATVCLYATARAQRSAQRRAQREKRLAESERIEG